MFTSRNGFEGPLIGSFGPLPYNLHCISRMLVSWIPERFGARLCALSSLGVGSVIGDNVAVCGRSCSVTR